MCAAAGMHLFVVGDQIFLRGMFVLLCLYYYPALILAGGPVSTFYYLSVQVFSRYGIIRRFRLPEY